MGIPGLSMLPPRTCCNGGPHVAPCPFSPGYKTREDLLAEVGDLRAALTECRKQIDAVASLTGMGCASHWTVNVPMETWIAMMEASRAATHALARR